MIPRVRQVMVKNYKSLAKVNVNLTPLTVLVGRNGSGKSNFVDALAFVQECLSASIEMAFRNRGGIAAVRRISTGHPTNIGVRLLLDLEDDVTAEYSFEIGAKPSEKFSVKQERCVVSKLLGPEHRFEVQKGRFVAPIPGIRAQVAPDRLALYAASATDEFRPVYDFLTSMHTYSIVPQRMQELQDADPGELLKPDGSNAAAVLKRLQNDDKDGYGRVCRLLSEVVEGIKSVEHRAIGQKETLQFKQDMGLKDPWTFEALNMSDGTIRVLGLLLAVYHSSRAKVIAIEEPEVTVHPAVAESIVQVLIDVANDKQIVFTTHSPDILDCKDLNDTQIKVVSMRACTTHIAPLADSSRDAIREKLYTPGELLRADELQGDIEKAKEAERQLNLFGPPHKPHGDEA